MNRAETTAMLSALVEKRLDSVPHIGRGRLVSTGVPPIGVV